MQITAAQLNQVAALLNTTDKNLVITAAIATLVKAGVDVQVAMDAVLGAGSFMATATSVYDQLRAA